MMEALPRTAAAIADGFSHRLHIGVQLAVVRRGRVLCDFALGDARPADGGAPAVAMEPATLMLWLSSSKPVAAVATMQLRERGLLQLEDRVERHLPEFAQNGKQAVTISHLLTHTCGFRFIDLGDATTPWEEIIRRICVAPLERGWVPGEKAGYHPYTSWYVLGEIIRRVSGVPFSRYVRESIFLPLGMDDCWIGMSANDRDAYGSRLGLMANTERRGSDAEPTLAPHTWSKPAGQIACAPGGNGHGPMRQLVRFYQMLLGEGRLDGIELLKAESVRDMISRRRVGMFDETFKHTLDWGWGIIPNNRRYGTTIPYGYGRHAGEDAFGHSGSQSSVGFADPQNDLAVALVFNGTCGEARHQKRIRSVLEALYEDLGLTRDD